MSSIDPSSIGWEGRQIIQGSQNETKIAPIKKGLKFFLELEKSCSFWTSQVYFRHVRFRYLLRWKGEHSTWENEKSLDKEFSMLHMAYYRRDTRPRPFFLCHLPMTFWCTGANQPYQNPALFSRIFRTLFEVFSTLWFFHSILLLFQWQFRPQNVRENWKIPSPHTP